MAGVSIAAARPKPATAKPAAKPASDYGQSKRHSPHNRPTKQTKAVPTGAAFVVFQAIRKRADAITINPLVRRAFPQGSG
jgi:hypothetical protein